MKTYVFKDSWIKQLTDILFVEALMLNLSQIQKPSSRDVLRKKCSENMQQIYRRTPMPKGDFSCKFAAYFQSSSY